VLLLILDAVDLLLQTLLRVNSHNRQSNCVVQLKDPLEQDANATINWPPIAKGTLATEELIVTPETLSTSLIHALT
jgi:hypothetical protein